MGLSAVIHLIFSTTLGSLLPLCPPFLKSQREPTPGAWLVSTELIQLGLETDSLYPTRLCLAPRDSDSCKASRWAEGKGSTAQCQHRTQQWGGWGEPWGHFINAEPRSWTGAQAWLGAEHSQPALHLSLGSGPALWTSSAGKYHSLPFRVGPTVHQSREGLGKVMALQNGLGGQPWPFPHSCGGIQEGYFDQFFFVKWQSIPLALKEGEGIKLSYQFDMAGTVPATIIVTFKF